MQMLALEPRYAYINTWKVHHNSCVELKKIIYKITHILAQIESALPRCNQGIEALASLHASLEECTLLLRYCSDSSKLYLAFCGDRIILRCERIRNSLQSWLTQLKKMVEPTLAAQITRIIDYLKTVDFTLDSSEDEARKVLLALLHHNIPASNSANLQEFKAFKFASFKLNITSHADVVIEKQSIRRLLSKIHDTNLAKKKLILNYFLYLVRKYGAETVETIANEGEEDDGDDVFDQLEVPMKFKSRRLSQISSCSSESSFSSLIQDLRLRVDNVSFRSSDTNSWDYVDGEHGFGQMEENSERFNCSSGTDNGTSLFMLAKLSVLPWPLRRQAVADVKNQLKDEQGFDCSVSTSYIKPVFKFLKEAHEYGDSGAKRHGAELLLMLLKECRTEVPVLPKDAMYDLFLFLDSEITAEAFPILEVLSSQPHYNLEIVASGVLYFVLEILKNTNKTKHHNAALRVVCNLSAHTDLAHHLIYLDCIQHLVPILDDLLLSGCCLKIMRNLCRIEESTAHFVENKNCIVSMGELVEVANEEQQEHALDILLYLCYKREDLRKVLMRNEIVACLEEISENGSCRGKLIAVEFLQLLTEDRSPECSVVNVVACDSTANNSCSSKSLRLFGRIKSRLQSIVFSFKD